MQVLKVDSEVSVCACFIIHALNVTEEPLKSKVYFVKIQPKPQSFLNLNLSH